MPVVNRIAEIREAKGWSQGALALALKTEVRQVEHWEANRLQPSLDEAYWLTEIFKCKLEDVFKWTQR
ncbi:MAG: helix-turn-helix transcriptional regulator [Christensenellaceae bacterium]|jgi:ribosome-binding protein aMBF1 (putative translation factor)